MKEVCQRCGEEDYDRRTLHMACFYAMNELGLPFEQYAITGEYRPKTGEKSVSFSPNGLAHILPVFADATGKKEDQDEHRYFTLRVCKSCRGDWLAAISDWFKNKPVRESCGSGIFVRRNGATVEITKDEWDRENPGREPVRARP